MAFDNFNPPESWKRVTAVMMIRAGCKDMEIMKTACVARNTVKSIRSELEESNYDYEKVVERKRRKDVSDLRTPEFVEKLQKKVQEDPSRSRTKLVEELGVGNTTVRNFTQDQKHNSQKNRCCVRNTPRGAHCRPDQVPAAVMVFGIISSDGDVMPPHFFPKGLRLDSEGYVALMRDVVVPG
ncbi:Uncharacterized protein FKW44_006071 [Caligus rogercresseyi]|uniref:Uncharacterized protein n=1 Tax=Caligus rogercresseyi TaxID=217165 RepID=A0A7T8QSI6_CALRO|nr:Uncharacterized protein FKW44_006071 [Caligus rogercresseyi]